MSAPKPTAKVRKIVMWRDSPGEIATCQWCGLQIGNTVYSLQHRRTRGMGGTTDERANLPANLVLVHGTGTTGCHGYIESHPLEATAAGFRVKQGTDPRYVPIKMASFGLVYLDDEGYYEAV